MDNVPDGSDFPISLCLLLHGKLLGFLLSLVQGGLLFY